MNNTITLKYNKQSLTTFKVSSTTHTWHGNTICVSIENVNREAKSISNGKVVDATLMTIDILKWTRPETSQWITTTMDQVINFQAKSLKRLGREFD